MARLEKLMQSPDLALRCFSSVFIVAAILSGIYFGGIFWRIVASVAAMVSLWEYYKLLSVKCDLLSPLLIMLSGAFILAGSMLDMTYASLLCTITCVIFVELLIEIIRRQTYGSSKALINIGATVSGLVYVILPWAFMIIIRTHDIGQTFLTMLFLCTWACDVAAYFVGSSFGKHLLCENVSPKKTWEGFWGGAFFSLVCGCLTAYVFHFPLMPAALMGLLFGIAGQLGDLGESLLKREAGVKDSGHIIPGHGGMLDRFDSILVNATIVFLMLEIIG